MRKQRINWLIQQLTSAEIQINQDKTLYRRDPVNLMTHLEPDEYPSPRKGIYKKMSY